jgi:hypothetical protein
VLRTRFPGAERKSLLKRKEEGIFLGFAFGGTEFKAYSEVVMLDIRSL